MMQSVLSKILFLSSHVDALLKPIERDSSAPEETISQFNETLLRLMAYGGAIVIAIAVIKLIIALAEQSASGKVQAAMMLGLGAMLIATDVVVAIITSGGHDGKTVAMNLVSIIASVMKVVSIILVAYAMLQLLLSFMTQDGQQKAEAGKLLGIGAAFFAAGPILDTLVADALDGKANHLVNSIVSVIASIGRFVGILLAMYALFGLIMAFKDHDGNALHQSSILLGVGIALFCLPIIFNGMGLLSSESISISGGSGSGRTPIMPPPRSPIMISAD